MHKQDDAETVAPEAREGSAEHAESTSTVEPQAGAESETAADAQASADTVDTAEDSLPAEPAAVRTTHEVELVRTVRIGPIMVTSAVVFALIATIVAFALPVQTGENYTVAQAAGFVIVPGAAIGLLFGGILSLILARAAKRKRGAAIAVRTDVR